MAINRNHGDGKFKFEEVTKDRWPYDDDPKRVGVFLSKEFLVQVLNEPGGKRLTVNRAWRKDGGWGQDITWDELQRIKRAVGYGDSYAVEVYPPDMEIVNCANMRHLWVMDQPLDIGWKRS
jgi:hypothetical protein